MTSRVVFPLLHIKYGINLITHFCTLQVCTFSFSVFPIAEGYNSVVPISSALLFKSFYLLLYFINNRLYLTCPKETHFCTATLLPRIPDTVKKLVVSNNVHFCLSALHCWIKYFICRQTCMCTHMHALRCLKSFILELMHQANYFPYNMCFSQSLLEKVFCL